jgi:hypothetical protein cdivTM_11147
MNPNNEDISSLRLEMIKAFKYAHSMLHMLCEHDKYATSQEEFEYLYELASMKKDMIANLDDMSYEDINKRKKDIELTIVSIKRLISFHVLFKLVITIAFIDMNFDILERVVQLDDILDVFEPEIDEIANQLNILSALDAEDVNSDNGQFTLQPSLATLSKILFKDTDSQDIEPVGEENVELTSREELIKMICWMHDIDRSESSSQKCDRWRVIYDPKECNFTLYIYSRNHSYDLKRDYTDVRSTVNYTAHLIRRPYE